MWREGTTHHAAPARRLETWCSLSSRASRSAWTAQVAGERSCSPRSRVRGWPCCCCCLALLPGAVGKGNPRVFCQEDVGGRGQSTANQNGQKYLKWFNLVKFEKAQNLYVSYIIVISWEEMMQRYDRRTHFLTQNLPVMGHALKQLKDSKTVKT